MPPLPLGLLLILAYPIIANYATENSWVPIRVGSYVRFWHLADIATDFEHVRFGGEADIPCVRATVR